MRKDRNHLFELLGLKKRNKNKLVQSLTHSSFNKKDEVKNNSRFVFLGMFGLKGTVARLIYDYAFGTGQQLQHLLGNTFSLAKLEKLFDSWDLSEYIRIGTDFDYTKHKHIFVYALFRLVEEEGNDEEKKSFIHQYLLAEDYTYTFRTRKNDYSFLQPKMLLSQKGKSNAKIRESKDHYNYKCEIWSESVCLAFHESKSKIYAKKAAIKKAIIFIVDADNIPLKLNQNIGEVIGKKEKEEKHQQFLARQAEKKAERERKKQAKIDQKAANEKARRMAKERKKQQMLEREKLLRAQANQTMSGKKRRFLEDKKK